MSSRAQGKTSAGGARAFPLICLFFAAAASAWSTDWRDFTAGSGRSENEFLIVLLPQSDLETQLGILSAIGEREEPYAADIIDAVSRGFYGKGEFRRELMLRVLLDSLFGPSRSEEEVKQRIEANREALDPVVRRLNDYMDPQLAGTVLRIIPLLGEPSYIPLVARACTILIEKMRATRGELSPMDAEYLLDLIGYIEIHPSADFLEACLTISRLSRDSCVVGKARAAAAAMASL